MNNVMIATKNAKNKKSPNLKEHSIAVKISAMKKVKIMLNDTFTA